MKIKNKTAKIFPFGDVIVPDIPSTNKKSKVKGNAISERNDLAVYNIGYRKGREDANKNFLKKMAWAIDKAEKKAGDAEREKNKKIIKWLKEIAEWNAHDKAWIERTIEKLGETR